MEAAEKAWGKADLDTQEAENKSELLPLHTAHALKYKDSAEHITRAVLVAEMNKEYKVPFLKEFMYCFYGMKKGAAIVWKSQNLLKYLQITWLLLQKEITPVSN